LGCGFEGAVCSTLLAGLNGSGGFPFDGSGVARGLGDELIDSLSSSLRPESFSFVQRPKGSHMALTLNIDTPRTASRIRTSIALSGDFLPDLGVS
jgi:hypothetical protein